MDGIKPVNQMPVAASNWNLVNITKRVYNEHSIIVNLFLLVVTALIGYLSYSRFISKDRITQPEMGFDACKAKAFGIRGLEFEDVTPVEGVITTGSIVRFESTNEGYPDEVLPCIGVVYELTPKTRVHPAVCKVLFYDYDGELCLKEPLIKDVTLVVEKESEEI